MPALPRTVAPETLDSLAARDPAAVRSRRDLQRVHRAMGTCRIVSRALRDLCPPPLPEAPAALQVLELGAGDGTLMLRVARALGPGWAQTSLTLLDRQAIVSPATIEAYAALGWRASARVADVFDWAAGPADPSPAGSRPARWDLIVANLFLHHFEGGQLNRLLDAIALRSDRFFACEPRRGWLALGGSHLIGALGVNAITRQDAVLSVHAGFREAELTAQWPHREKEWLIEEYRAGPFSHCFQARRRALPGPCSGAPIEFPIGRRPS